MNVGVHINGLVSVLGFGGLCSQSCDFRSFGVLRMFGRWLRGQVYQDWCWGSDELGASETLGLVAVEPWVRSICQRLLEHTRGQWWGDTLGSGPWHHRPEPRFVPGPRPGGGHAEVGQLRLTARLPRPPPAGGGLRTVRIPANHRARSQRAKGGGAETSPAPQLMNMRRGRGLWGLGLASAARGAGSGGRSSEEIYIRPGARRPPHSRVRRLRSFCFLVFSPA